MATEFKCVSERRQSIRKLPHSPNACTDGKDSDDCPCYQRTSDYIHNNKAIAARDSVDHRGQQSPDEPASGSRPSIKMSGWRCVVFRRSRLRVR